MRQYRRGTFDKHVAYGQRDRKMRLIARGIMDGFKVTCRTENDARNLAYALRLRARRLASDMSLQFGVKVKVEGRKVYAIRTKKSVG
ncbi:MAG TPA: hypothetical protein VMU35_02900 [Methylomirabilota bacterium]|nr:hypothetical protein [Methylomirabilota bacterium]